MSVMFNFVGRWLKSKLNAPAPEMATGRPLLVRLPKTHKAAERSTAAETEIEIFEGPRERLESECYEIGLKSARKSWKQQPDEIDLKALESKADALAQSRHRTACEAKDERQREKLCAVERDIRQRQAECDAAAARVRECRQRLAEAGPRRPYPRISPVFRQGAVIGLLVAFAPSFHDLMIGLPSILKWVFGAICALGVALLTVHGILPPGPEESKKSGGD